MAKLARWGLFSLFGIYALISPLYFRQVFHLTDLGAMSVLMLARELFLYLLGSLSLLIAIWQSRSSHARGKFCYLAAALLLAVTAIMIGLSYYRAIYMLGGCSIAVMGFGLSLAHRPEHAPA
ncbi:hypothetical protein KIF53_00465 [Chromobacterium subtsugae]|uniref:Uncharacterized protein n=1 Tax=Chromobacterium subtsugae TaxID=251747 RepID=A0ABS7F9J5_9NEIS|nr:MULTISPECIES: hypothetical protein [Chromobacterium]KUM02098.1 hypothetical protein Cv017_04980 [Chromobacterium subtsugae]KZE83175.1 hypothetical protein AWB61_06045 [Chromobacterium sp. F49]MBW7567135.1 hypothetical protein [Chromobacterium subtsugae]MBW8286105.1 hypothetical protein [Chromobacterium subtsugae]WSE91840.1 hypothetical protein U6115_00965 [Chromobacterium subtsugae]